jgi:ABC-type glycerol-3-phosphate transport system substrate-binding protein
MGRRVATALSRRQVLRGAAGVVGLAAGAALASCAGTAQQAGSASSAAAPSAVANVTTVPFQLWTPAVPNTKAARDIIQQFVDQNFNAKHPGVRAVWVGGGNMQGVATSVLAGASNTPWVVASCCGDWNIIRPFLEPLDSYLKADNIDVNSTWKEGQLSRFQDSGGTYGLPEDAASDAYLYRQDILDELGIPYPDPGWDWREAQKIWQQCTGKNSKGAWRYGVAAPFGAGTTEGLPTVIAGWGGSFQSPDRTRCLADQPQAIAAAQYWIDMVLQKVCTEGDGWPNQGIFNGTCVFTTGAEPTILQAVQQLGSSAKWDFLPWPSFPVRSVGKLHDNFYGMLASAPNKELAWEVLKWAAIEPDWQRFYMSLALAPPAVANLLEQWYAVMRATAPVLQNKKLEYWGQPTLKGLGVYDYEFFRYAPVQANQLVSSWWNQIWTGKVSVAEGMRQMAAQINALQATAAAQAGALQAKAKAFPTSGPELAMVPTGI